MIKTGKAYAPAAISSFFTIHESKNNKAISNLERIGARGGGFGLEKGVHTKITVQEAEKTNIKIFINSERALDAKTTKEVVQTLLAKTTRKYDVTVEHQIDVPVGSGFGTSAGGALTAGLALTDALGLPLTYNQIGKVAHVAEIKCQTGLGTVSSLTFCGGCVLVVEPGAPGICQLDRIPITSDYVVVAGFVESAVQKKRILTSAERKKKINRYGKQTMKKILAKPTLENFLNSCWGFSQKAGFATEKIRKLVEAAKDAGALGAAQNMIGEAAHALVLEENALKVAEAFKHVLCSEKVIVSRIDFQGARLTR